MISQAVGQQWCLAISLLALGQMAFAQDDNAGARARLTESLASYKATQHTWFIAQVLNSLGDVARLEGEYAAAAQRYEESLALFREQGAQADIPASLHNLGHVALARGEYARARRLFVESLALHRSLGNKAGMAESLAGVAGVLAQARGAGEPMADRRKVLQAAHLFGAADAVREAIKAPMWPAERADYERNLAAARAQLDDGDWQASWAEGRAMPLEQAIAYALEETPDA